MWKKEERQVILVEKKTIWRAEGEPDSGVCWQPRDEHFSVTVQQHHLLQRGHTDETGQSLWKLSWGSQQVPSIVREDGCENVNPSLALTLRPVFYQALVLELLGIHVRTWVSVRPLLSALSPGPWQEGEELTSSFQHEMSHSHPSSAHPREQAPFLNVNGQEKEEWY